MTHLDKRESKLLRDCITYSDDPYGAPNHLLMVLVAKLYKTLNNEQLFALVLNADLPEEIKKPYRDLESKESGGWVYEMGNPVPVARFENSNSVRCAACGQFYTLGQSHPEHCKG